MCVGQQTVEEGGRGDREVLIELGRLQREEGEWRRRKRRTLMKRNQEEIKL